MKDEREFPFIRYPEDGRENIKNGDLLFCHGTSMLHKGIQKFTGSYWNHVAFLFWWKNRVVVLESSTHGVSIVPLSKFLREYRGIVAIARTYNLDGTELLNSGSKKALLSTLIDRYLGADYDTITLIKQGFVRLLGKLGIRLNTASASFNLKWYCSELVRVAFQNIGVRFELDSYGAITPGQIADDPRVKIFGCLV